MDHLVGAFNQKKALVEAFSVMVITDGSFAALLETVDTFYYHSPRPHPPRPLSWVSSGLINIKWV